jgi:hypothetical protein
MGQFGFLHFLIFFIVIFLFVIKIEDHFSYLRILNPEKLGKYNSLLDAQRKLKFIGFRFSFIVMAPFFLGRNRQLENHDNKLNQLAKKIQIRCYQIWVTLLAYITFEVIFWLSR